MWVKHGAVPLAPRVKRKEFRRKRKGTILVCLPQTTQGLVESLKASRCDWQRDGMERRMVCREVRGLSLGQLCCLSSVRFGAGNPSFPTCVNEGLDAPRHHLLMDTTTIW